MKIRLNRTRIGWLIIVALVATPGIVISLIVLGSPERDLTALRYYQFRTFWRTEVS